MTYIIINVQRYENITKWQKIFAKKTLAESQRNVRGLGVSLLFLDKGNDPEEDNGADNGGDDLAYKGSTPVDTKPTQDIAADKTADNTNQKVNPEAEAGTLHDFTCQETGKCTDENCNDNTHNFYVLKVYNCSRKARSKVMRRW